MSDTITAGSSVIGFSQFFITRERFERFLGRLEQTRVECFKPQNIQKDYSQILNDNFSQEVSTAILTYIKSLGQDTQNLTGLDEGLKRLSESFENYRFLKLSTAIDLSEHVIKEIYIWVRQNIGDDVILDLRVKPYVLGGVELSFEGKYMDMTVLNKLDKLDIKI